MKIVTLVMLAAACGPASDTEITPRWDEAPTEEAREMWRSEVQDVIDLWQGVIGDGCRFPLFVGSDGPAISLVGPDRWPFPGAAGMYDPKDGSVVVKGRAPGMDGTVGTLAHELGHAAGLHHSDDRSSIMYGDIDGVAEVPSIADGATLRRLLGCSGGAP